MISMITELWSMSCFKPIQEHVYGHQDINDSSLTRQAKLNNKMDLMAKDIALEQIATDTTLWREPSTLGIGSIRCGGKLITSRIQQTLYTRILHDKLISWYSKKHHIPHDVLKNNVSWRAYNLARKEGRSSLNTFITKWVSGNTATGRVMLMRKKRLHSNCPRCNAVDEHTTHVLQCQSDETCEMRTDILDEFRLWLQTVNTQYDIEVFLFKGIKSWLTQGSYHFGIDSLVHPDLYNAFRTQVLIGWEALLFGFVCTGIIEHQQIHYNTLGSRKTGNRWGVQLISRLWTIIQSHWNHRNATLHETETLARLSGLEELKSAVCKEYDLGLGDLPSVYTSYFLPPLAFILQKPTAYIKRWFLLIRSGRESCSIDFDIDIFSTDSSLRSWVGLRAI